MKVRNDLAISETGFIFDPVSGESFSLNEIGTEIFNLYKEQKSQIEIKEIILKKYDVNDSELDKSLIDFEGMMKEYNFIQK